MYSQHAKKTTSEKLTVAWVEPSQRVVSGWSLDTASVWKVLADHWVVNVLVNGIALTPAASRPAMTAGSLYFDPRTKTLYVWLLDSTSPKLSHAEVVYRLFFSDATSVDLPFDMNGGRIVPYLPYLSRASNGGSSFDPNNPQIPIEGSGKLDLNNDGFFANIFDRLTWQTKRAVAYSVSRSGDALKLYEGLITSKAYNGNSVSFGLKDSLYRLRSQIALPLYSEADGVLSDSLLGTPKRRIYGRVAGLKAESIDQQLDAYLVSTIDRSDFRTATPITFSSTTASDIVVVSSTDAKKELCADDGISIDGSDFKVKTLSRRDIGLAGDTDVTFSQPISTSQLRIAFAGIDTSRLSVGMHLSVARLKNASATLNAALFGISTLSGVSASFIDVTLTTATSVGSVTLKVSADEMCITAATNDTSFQLSEVAKATKTDLTARVRPIIPYRRLNRSLFLAHHALHEASETIAKVKRGNLFELPTVSDFAVNDIVVFAGTKLGQIAAIDPIASTITTTNLINPLPQTGETVVRVAVQDITFNNRSFTPLRDYVVTNLVGGATCKLSTTAEREAFPSEVVGTIVWKDGAKVVVASAGLFETFHNRDWVRPTAETDWYEIEERFSNNIVVLKAPYAGTSGSKLTTANKPTYIGDKSNVLVNTYGITFDGTPGGQLVRSAPDAVKHLLLEAGIADADDASFSTASETAPYLVSYTVPLKARSKPPTYRDVVNDLNSSILGVTYVSNEFKLLYRSLNAERAASTARYITDFDVVSFKQSADSSTIYRKIIAQYRHQDLDPITLEPTTLVTEAVSNYVDNAGVAGQTYSVDLYLYDALAAETVAARLMFFNELPKTKIQIEGGLDLNELFLTDLVLFRSDSLYSRYGSSDLSVIGLVTASKKTGTGATITISDLGNIFSRAAVVAPNLTPDFDAASADQRRFAGFITDASGVVENDNDVGTNLIS